jgi:mycofactocin system transcriptional regulator
MNSTFRRVGLDNVTEVAIIWHRVPKWKRWVMQPVPGHRVGRRRSTTWDHISNVAIDLFAARGFDEVSVDDVAVASGIGRRTLFRYYPSKNALPWGDFDAHLDHMRDLLNELEVDVPVRDALRTALLAFNTFDETEAARHRRRMRVILGTAALQAYSMTMYAGWRAVVAAFVAKRLGTKAEDLVPQTVAWTMLGAALSAYEHWLADESVSLAQALGDAFDTVSDGLSALGDKGR